MRRRRRRGCAPASTPRRPRSTSTEVRFDRRTSYIGVMIDDLTLQGVSEPYRMMTARAEYRLSLRADNATTRLGEAALAAGCVSDRRQQQIEAHLDARGLRLTGQRPRRGGPTRSMRLTSSASSASGRRSSAIARSGSAVSFDYRRVPGLSTEMVERLSAARPETLDQASRIAGVTPAALSALYVAAVAARRHDRSARRRLPAALFHVKHSALLERFARAPARRERPAEPGFASTLDTLVGAPHPRFGAARPLRPVRAHRGSTSAPALACRESSSLLLVDGPSRWSSRGASAPNSSSALSPSSASRIG